MADITERFAALSPEQRKLLLQQITQKKEEVSRSHIRSQGRDTNIFPLSFAQQRLWFLDQLEPGSVAYLVSGARQISGVLDAKIFERSLEALIERHEGLRTTFQTRADQPVQVIHPVSRLHLPFIDLRGLHAEERKIAVRQLRAQEAQRPCDLRRGPLLRIYLLRLHDDEHILLLSMHHIISDGWSGEIFVRELQALYRGFMQGQPASLPTLPVQYADFAVWQHQWLQGDLLEAQLEYWKQQLQGISPLELPTDHLRPPVQTFQGARQSIVLPTSLQDQLLTLSRQENVTLFMLLLSAFQVLLMRYTGQTDISVGTPITNRNRPEVAGLIGFFVNTLVLRTDLAGDLSFLELLRRVRKVALDAYAHQDVPFEQLVDALQPERDLSRSPLFQVSFSVVQRDIREPDPSGQEMLHLSEMDDSSSLEEYLVAKFDLLFNIISDVQGLHCGIEYNTDLFEAATIQRLLEHWEQLLQSIVTAPTRQLAHFSLLTARESQLLLQEWNHATTLLPDNICIHELIEAQVARTPEAIAVFYEDQQLTYAALNERANKLGHYLQRVGVGPEVLVGICMERSLEAMIGIIGILKAGGAYIPLDPTTPGERLALMLGDAQVALLLTQQHLQKQFLQSSKPIICLDKDWQILDQESADNPISYTCSANLAYLIYTSGSTGTPKGVMVTHRNVLQSTLARHHHYPQPVHSYLLLSPLSFDSSVAGLFWTLTQGGRLVFPADLFSYDLSVLARFIVQQGISHLLCVPSLYAWLLGEDTPFAFSHSLRQVIVAGETCSLSLLERHRACLPEVALVNEYGPTEGTVWSTVYFDDGQPLERAVPIGQPIATAQVYLLDTAGQPVPIGVRGELFLGGAGLARGYLQQAASTAERFLPHPFSHEPGARLYRTGDLACYRSDGSIEFLGRVDQQVKLRGHRIELEEIETILSRHPVVDECAVILKGEQDQTKEIFAYITYNESHIQSAEDRLPRDLANQEQHLSLFRDMYNQLYLQKEAYSAQDASINTSIWTSSYTNQPLAEEEVLKSVDETVAHILALHPQRVLEIGCGTGLLLFRIAPSCSQYEGIDLSEIALNHLRNLLDERQPALKQVTLHHGAAHDVAQLYKQRQCFDTIIINEVIQHFPDIEYFERILENLVPLVKPDGNIFLGGLRSLAQLEMFHTSVQLFRASPDLSLKQLRLFISEHQYLEKDLVVNPSFFATLHRHIPALSLQEIQLKRGKHQNEITRFKYDVVLKVDENAGPVAEIPWLDWQDQNMTVADMYHYLATHHPSVVGVKRIPNARLLEDARALALLTQEQEELKTVSDVRNALQTGSLQAGIDPEDLWELGQKLPYVVDTRWWDDGLSGDLAVIFRHTGVQRTSEWSVPFAPEELLSLKSRSIRANNPRKWQLSQDIAEQLRGYMQEKIPEYMVPSQIISLDILPRTPHGKIDRRALQEFNPHSPEVRKSFTSARTQTEELIASIWREVLKRPQVSIHDNFFALGGHSLLATQLMSRLRTLLRVEIPLRNLFEVPTIAGLAQQVESALRGGVAPAVPALTPIPRTQDLPLSFAQQRLWFLDQLEPGNIAYLVPIVRRLHGSLHTKALESSMDALIQRHESLRTTFALKAGQPVQVIHPAARFCLPIIDLRGLNCQAREDQLRSLASQERSRPFALTTGPLLRVSLLRLQSQEHVMLLTMHHILFDARSYEVFLKELVMFYKAFILGESCPLPPLSIHYADFATWQRQWLQGEILDRQLAYWKRQLTDIAPLELPTDYPRPPVQTFRGAYLSRLLPSSLLEKLTALSQSQGVTLFMLLLSAFQVLLARYSGQSDICVGTAIANRTHSELEEMIGFFVNTLVLRVNLSGNPSFTEVIAQVRESTLHAYAHQDVPFEQLVEILQPEHDMSRSPLFQVMFGTQQATEQPEYPEGLTPGEIDIEHSTTKFDLTFNAVASERGLDCGAEYNTDLFAPDTIERLLGHWQRLLEGIVEAPQTRIHELPLLTKGETHLLLEEWAGYESQEAFLDPLPALFSAQAARIPDALALVSASTSLSYGQLERRANQLASYLQQEGVKSETLVGVALGRSVEWIIALLAILKAGGGYMPLNLQDPPQRLADLVEDAGIRFVLTGADWQALPLEWQPRCLSIEKLWAEKLWTRSEPVVSQTELPRVEREQIAYVIYTSGSTGKPKGVAATHRGLGNLARAQAQAFGVERNSHVLQFASPSFDASIAEIAVSLLAGASLHLADQAHLLPGDPLLNRLERQAITVVTLPPSTLRVLPVRPLPALRTLIAAGETCTEDIVERWGTGRHFWNAYGPTEATVCATLEECVENAGKPAIGRMMANVQGYVLDEWGQAVPVGVTGELYIGGWGVARGYLNRPELTAERFVPHPWNEQGGERLYRTGDRVRYRDDGKLEYLGRQDGQVKVRGYRIELGEIEAVLGKHEEVRECAVVVQKTGEGDQQVVAYVVRQAEARERNSKDLREWLQERLAEYLLPSQYVELEELPRTTSGKIDRQKLPLLQEQGWHAEQEYEEARTALEAQLVEIWCEILGDEWVGIHDNFFELGGHSLLATRLISRIEAALQVELSVQTFFEAPTIAELAQCIEQQLHDNQKAELPPLVPVARTGHLPLSFAQQRLWFLAQLEPESVAYLIPSAQRLRGTLNATILEKSLHGLLQRHESLRTTFSRHEHENQPVQVIHPAQQFRLPVVDLRYVLPEDRESEARRLVDREAQHSCDLASGPLVRIMLLRLDAREHILLLTMHHIVSDGWSNEIFVRELITLYQAFLHGQPSPLPPLLIQYADFAVWQRQWLQGDLLNEQLEYWKQQLQDLTPLELPTDHPRPPVQTFRGARQTVLLPASLHRRLITLGQQEDVTLFMLSLAAFQVLLAHYTGQTDISVGTPIANRIRPELEGLIGFFVNTLVLRTDLSGNPSFREVLRTVRALSLEAYAHQDVPFEQLVDMLQPERDLSRSPLFQVMFSIQQASANPETKELQDLVLSGVDSAQITVMFDLAFSLINAPQGLHCGVEYNVDIFDDSTIKRFLERWQRLLEVIAEQPQMPVFDISLLTAAEREEILYTWNATTTPLPTSASLQTLVQEQARRTPDEIALVCEDACLSYDCFTRSATQLARLLRIRGDAPGRCIAHFLERSLEGAIALLAILKAGAIYVPLDPATPMERLSGILQETRASVLLTQKRLHSHLSPEIAEHALCLEECWNEVVSQKEIAEIGENQIAENEQLAYIMYTSGSTGRPKGVMIPQQAITNRLWWGIRDVGMQASDHVAQVASWGFDIALWELFGAWLVGGRTVLVPTQEIKEGQQLLRRVREEAVSVLHLIPSLLRVLIQEPEFAQCRDVRCILCGGEVVHEDLVREVLARLKVPVHQFYGPTEAAISVTGWKKTPEEQWQDMSLGRPIANTQLYVVDRYNRPVVPGVKGEICIGGDALAWGYLGRAEQTAESFVPDPFSGRAGARLYRTGDTGSYSSDGELRFAGRRDAQIKLRGYRIEPAEIEARLLEHPAVHECVVIVQADEAEAPRLVAYVVGKEAQEVLDESTLRIYLQKTLPSYMIPASFVQMEALPLNANGKIDRKALLALKSYLHGSGASFVAPRTANEKALAAVWSQVLKVDQVSIHDNFFSLGGDSILSIQVIARARLAGLHLTPKQLFQYQTIFQLASVVETSEMQETTQSLVDGPIPLTPIQQRFFALDLPERHHYNQAMMLEASERLRSSWLEQALDHLLRLHDALRLYFVQHSSTWQQYDGGLSLAIPYIHIDVSRLPIDQQLAEIAVVATSTQASLNLQEPPLFRCVLFERGNLSPACLLIVIHHLVVDSVSWRILLDDLETAYLQISRGEAVRLPTRTTLFQRWAQELQQYARSDALRTEIPYWLAPQRSRVASLPVDMSVGTNSTLDSDEIVVTLSAEETGALLQEVPPVYHTQINDALLAALALAFTAWTGQPCLLVDLEGHGREEILKNTDLTHTIGWFTTLFPALLDITQATTPGEVLKLVKEQLRQIPQRGIGYGMLRYLSNDAALREQLASLPPAQVSFNYLGQVDSLFSARSLLRHSHIPSGPAYSAAGQRSYLLMINGGILDGCLHISWLYDRQTHQAETIQRLAQDYLNALRALIAHCLSPEAGGYTPSDFAMVDLNQAQLDLLTGTEREIEDIYPLAPMQEGMLFHSAYAPTSGIYVEQVNCQIAGKLDRSAFKESWRQVISHHPTLRTSFHWQELQKPLQMVHRQFHLPWEEQDWRGYSHAEQQEKLSRLLQDDRKRGFDLQQAPLLRLMLLHLADDLYQFVWSNHHLLLDGWSLSLLFKQIFDCYQANTSGNRKELPASQPYREYIAWLQQQDQRAAELFWRQCLQGMTAPTPLVIEEKKRAGASGEQHAVLRMTIDERTTSALQKIAQHYQVTMNTLVQGAWALILSYYSGEERVLFGTTVAGRPPALTGVESMIGIFINTIPTCISISPETPLASWLQGLQAHQVEARQYEYSSLTQIQDLSDIPHELPLFESIVAFENYPFDDLLPGGASELQFRGVQTTAHTNYPLSISVTARQTIFFKATYDSERFTEAAIQRLLGHLRTVLEAFTLHPDQRIEAISPLTAAEREEIVHSWNETRTPLIGPTSLQALVQAQTRRTPDAIALSCEDACLSYACLDRLAGQVAHVLYREGGTSGTCVVHYLERSLEGAIALLGILKAGGIYVPVDPATPAERLRGIVQETRTPILLTQQHLRARLPEVLQQYARCLEECWQASTQQQIDALKAEEINEATGQHVAYIMYTSGSTGRPKGVMVSHQAIVNRLWWGIRDAGINARDHGGQVASWGFDIALWELFGPWLVGARVVIVPDQAVREGAALIRRVQEQAVSVLHLVPSLLSILVQDTEFARCQSVHCMLCGGEAVHEELVREVMALLEVPMHQFYGPTEAAISVTSWKQTPGEQWKGISLGRPIANAQVYVVDRYGRPVAPGVRGEIWIGGLGLSWGYLGRAEQTAERFVPDPFSGEVGARVYRTGDIGIYRSNGELVFVGRVDTQVKIRGHRVEPGEIEAILLEHPTIHECVVLFREDIAEEGCLIAYMTERAGKEIPSPTELRGYLQEKVPDYMVPQFFVTLDAFPLTTNGKVKRQALPLPITQEFERSVVDTARTPVQELLVEIYRDLLKQPQIDLDDNFFEMGGHSLLAMRLIAQVRAILQVEISLPQLFESPTIADLSKLVEQALGGEHTAAVPPLEPVTRSQPLPLSFAQQRLWVLDQLGIGRTAYLIPAVWRLKGQLNVRALERSFDAMSKRHEILRTTFQQLDGQPVQIIHPAGSFCLPLVDLSRLGTWQQCETAARRLAEQEAHQPCSLSNGPLMRTVLLSMDRHHHIMFLTTHHIISDGWSNEVFLRELTLLYQAFAEQRPSPLLPLPVQYADFAVWQRNWLQGEALQALLEYWKNRLKGATPLNVPTDHPRTEEQSNRGASYSFVLPAHLSEQIVSLSRQEGVTLFMTLLAAFQVQLYRYTKKTDVIVGTDIANRTLEETEGLIGFFINLLVLRTDLQGTPIFRNVLHRVREVVLGAYVHQDIPFDMLVEHLRIERNRNRTPLVQVLFVLQNIPATVKEWPDLTIEAIPGDTTTAKFDLALFMYESGKRIGGTVNYSTDLFEEQTIATMMHQFESLLRSAIDQPDIPIDALDISTDAEKAARARFEKELLLRGSGELKASRGEEVELSGAQIWQIRSRE